MKIVEEYQADVGLPITEVDRNTIINVALGHVIQTVGHYYPEASTKETLAAAIVAAFPQPQPKQPQNLSNLIIVNVSSQLIILKVKK